MKRDVGAIRLERGTTLAGRVRCGGVPKERTTVIATWYGTKKPGTRPAGDLRLWVEDSRVIWPHSRSTPTTTAASASRASRTVPTVSASPPRIWGCALHPDAYAEVDFLTRAPNERLGRRRRSLALVIEVSDGEKLVQHAIVTLDGRDGIRLNSNTSGEVGVVLHSGRRHHATVEAAGFVPAALDVTSAESGGRRRERVTLAVAPPKAPRLHDDLAHRRRQEIRVDVYGPDGVRLSAPCRVRAPDGSPLTRELVERRPVVEIVSAERTGWATDGSTCPTVRPSRSAAAPDLQAVDLPVGPYLEPVRAESSPSSSAPADALSPPRAPYPVRKGGPRVLALHFAR